MTTPRTVSYRYSSPPAAVAALLCDADFLRARNESAGDEDVEVRVEPVGDARRVVTARSRKSSVPAFARKLIGNANRIIDDSTWRADGDSFRARFTITIEGAPVTVEGEARISPAGEGSRYENQFTVTARVPLVAGKVEAAVADQIAETVLAHARRNEARLSSFPPPPSDAD